MTPGARIRLLLLDFDGTLADTRRANTQAYVAALGESGYTLTEEEYAERWFGMRCDEFLARYGIADPAERERLRLRKIALYPRFFDTLRLNRPLWAFCRAFRARGGRVWIVSTGSPDNILNAMRHLGLGAPGEEQAPEGCVDGILTGADVERPKPAPECFLEAMRGVHTRRDAHFRGFGDRARSRPPQRRGLFQGGVVNREAFGFVSLPARAFGATAPAGKERSCAKTSVHRTGRLQLPDAECRKRK